MEKSEFAADRRVVLRGTTPEVIDEIPDGKINHTGEFGDLVLKQHLRPRPK